MNGTFPKNVHYITIKPIVKMIVIAFPVTRIPMKIDVLSSTPLGSSSPRGRRATDYEWREIHELPAR